MLYCISIFVSIQLEINMALSRALALANLPLPPASRLLFWLAVTVATWELRRRTRKSLNGLSPHLLADIGIDPAQADTEMAKRFWRA